MDKDLAYYMGLPYKVKYEKLSKHDGGGWLAYIPQLGKLAFCSDGETKEEALKGLNIIKEELFKDYIEEGDTIPEPNEKSEHEPQEAKTDTFPRKPKFPDTKLFKEGKEEPEQENEEKKKVMKKMFNGKCKDCKFKTKSVKGSILCPFGGIREPRSECNIIKADIETKAKAYEDTLKKMKKDLDKKVIVVDLNKLVDRMEEVIPVRGEEEPKDVQIDNLLKKNKELDEKLAEYRCLGTIEEIKKLKESRDVKTLVDFMNLLKCDKDGNFTMPKEDTDIQKEIDKLKDGEKKVMTKQTEEKKDPWVKLMFNDKLIARKLYECLPCGAAIIHNKIRLKGSDIEFDRKSLLEEAEKSFDKNIPNWRDKLIWICGG